MTYTVKNLLELNEAKQVGTIYHFTTIDGLKHMMKQSNQFELYSRNEENISLTRNPQLGVIPPNANFKHCDVRIALDGDKISQNHKIKPLLGLATDDKNVFDHQHTNRVKRHSGEAEEVVLHHPFNIKPFIKHIHIIKHSTTQNDVETNIIPELEKQNILYDHNKSYTQSTNLKEGTFNEMYDWNEWVEILKSN